MDVVSAAAGLLGTAVARADRLHGGDLSAVLRLTLQNGDVVVAKGGPRPRIEADMLRWLARAGVPAPEVIAADEQVLIMSVVSHDGHMAWADLGRVLGRLHGIHGRHYGWQQDYAFGTVRIENGQTDDWPAFWATCRLKPCRGYLPKSLEARLTALITDLPRRLPTKPAASLLHGDLWGGNILSAGGRVSALIDPACCYGHAEVDLAMLTLFDRPPLEFFDAYAPAPDWQDRQPIYQLWPALVHVRLFGSDYYDLVDRLLAAAGFG